MARKFLTALDLAKNELQNAAVQSLASAPGSPVKFQLYGNTGDNTVYWWDGSQWVPAKDTGGAAISPGTITSETTFGASKTDGSATTYARSDHGHGNPTHDNAAHSAIALSALGVPTASVNLNNQRLINVGTPSAGTDGANRDYVDNAVNGLAWKDPVRAATTANITLSGTQTVDGVSLLAGDRVLVKDQSSAVNNGLYSVAAGAWTRTTDADGGPELEAAAVWVNEGTTNGDKAFVCTTNAPITPGSSNLVFVQFGAGAAYTAGAGLTLTANDFAVGAGTGILVAADSVAVDTGYLSSNYASVASAIKRLAFTVGGSTSQVVTHSFNTRDVIVNVYRVASPYDTVECDVERTDLNNVTVRFATAPAASEYRVVVLA